MRSSFESNDHGFVSIWFLTLLPVLIAFGFLVLMAFFHTEIENKIRKICYTTFFHTQDLVSQKINRLLSFNPRSVHLRLQQRQAEAKLAIAIASENPAAVAAAQADIQRIHRLREILDIRQKALVAEGQMLLNQSQARALRELNSLQIGLSTYLLFQPLAQARFAVQADDQDLAPTFSTDPKLESVQELGVRWQKLHLAQGPLQPWIQGSFQENKICSVIPRFKNNQWMFQVNQDKFW